MIDLLSETDSQTDGKIPGCLKHHKPIYNDSNLEDVSSVLRHLSISDKVFEPIEVKKTSSKVKNERKKRKETKKTIV